MIIAIDGPAASGKGTLGRRLAAHFGLPHLDTGLLYRAVAQRLLAAGETLDDVAAATRSALAELDASFFRVRFDRLTPAEKRYLRAMATLGTGPHRSGDVADALHVKVSSVAPTRNNLIGSRPSMWCRIGCGQRAAFSGGLGCNL